MSALVAFLCLNAVAIDGDTIRCSNSQQAVRLSGIDAPEIGRCKGRANRVCVAGNGLAARNFAQGALDLGTVTVMPLKTDLYGRAVAIVLIASGENLSCSLVESGFAEYKATWDHKKKVAKDCPALVIKILPETA